MTVKRGLLSSFLCPRFPVVLPRASRSKHPVHAEFLFFSLEGLLNGRKFDGDAVMLKDTPQKVTGRKTFVTDTPEGVAFKALKISGLVNGVDVAELARNQVNYAWTDPGIIFRRRQTIKCKLSEHEWKSLD